MFEDERVPFGCKELTELLEGGFERGAVTQLFGSPGVGKTNVVMDAVVETIGDGGHATVIDTEGLSMARLNQLFERVDDPEKALEERLLMKEVYDFEEQQRAIENIERVAEQTDLVVIDSLTGFYRLERDLATDGEEGELLRDVARQITTLLGLARKHNFAVVVTNQVFSGMDPGEEVRALGGNIVSHWTGAIIRLRQGTGDVREAVVEKHGAIADGKCARFKITDRGVEGVDGEGTTAAFGE